MLWITGDTHQFEIEDRFNIEDFASQRHMNRREDYVIICGDFGVWDNSKEENRIFDWLERRNFTTLFVSGNHENYDILNSLPEYDWNGGKVNFIRPHVIHLKRGYVFTIDNKKIFTFGGASSHDIWNGILEEGDPRIEEWYQMRKNGFRINHISWWKEELPTKEEMNRGLDSLAAHDYKVDYIISHSPSTFELMRMGAKELGYKTDCLTDYLDLVMNNVQFEKHYFGHMHVDYAIDNKRECIYENINLIK